MRNLFFICLFAGLFNQAYSQRILLKPEIGIAGNMEQDSLYAAAGYSCIIESISRRISPRTVSDEVFRENIARIKQLKVPIYAFNLFIPAELKLVGPNVDEPAVLAYVEAVMARVSQTNTRMIVWGSGGARRIPDGFDRKVAMNQFIDIARKIAIIAEKYQVILALENLNSTETNFINTVEEALYVVKKVNRPGLRLNADIYHMLKEGESPKVIRKTKKYLVHVEIAEKEDRSAPHVGGSDFMPYLRELKRVGYHNRIVIEAQWKSLPESAAVARRYLQEEVEKAYTE